MAATPLKDIPAILTGPEWPRKLDHFDQAKIDYNGFYAFDVATVVKVFNDPIFDHKFTCRKCLGTGKSKIINALISTPSNCYFCLGVGHLPIPYAKSFTEVILSDSF